MPQAEQRRALAFVEEALAALGPDDRAALILFGADALVERPLLGAGPLGEIASIPRTHQTDLEGAIRLGLALFPSGAARRMVILSDGRPTTGEAERAVRLARAQGVRVDVVPLLSLLQGEGRGEVEAWLANLSAPSRLHQGEEFTLSVTARATAEIPALLMVLAGDRVVAQEEVRLNPGVNTFAVPLTAGEPGFLPFRAVLVPATDTYPQNNTLSAFALIEGPPRILLITPPSQEGDGGGYLEVALQAAGLEVQRSTPGAMPSDPAGLAEYAAVVLVDTPARSLSPRALRALHSYVRDLGGGLVAVGGPHSYGVGGWYGTPLEETLPVEMTIRDPQRFPPMSIVVVIDKSGSMSVEEDGVPKIRLAGEAAARVAELINDLDEITVIAFDDRPVDVIGPLPGSEREEVIQRVIRLQPGGGGIYVRESLQVALRYLDASERKARHIILLADGADSEHQEGVREMVAEQMAAQNITLSAVAIGAGPDLRFLEEIATLGGGRYHFTDRAANLPVILAEETQLAMRSYIVEEPFYPRQAASSPILTGIEAVPLLVGYVATTAKLAAQVILTTHQGDPLLAAWQYGLGRAVAWTSDATARWAALWVQWDEFPRFWAQAVRWTIVEHADVPAEVSVVLEGDEARVILDALDERGEFINGLDASLNVVGPEGAPLRVELAQSAPGRYEGAFTPQAEGAYLMRLVGQAFEPGVPDVALTTGWAMGYSPEYAALEGDPAYLSRLAELGGGAVLERPIQALAHDIRGSGLRRDLWPYLLGWAAVLLPFDVGVRRLALGRRDLARAWAWVVNHLPHRRRLVAEASLPVSRLFEARSRVRERKATEALLEAPPPAPAKQPVQSPVTPPVSQAKAQGQATTAETLTDRLLRKKRERAKSEDA